MNSDITFLPFSCCGELQLLDRLLPGRCAEALQHSWPAAVDVPAHRGAALRSHRFELAMLKFDQGCVRSFDRKTHLDLRADSGVGLPAVVDVPADDEAVRRIPKENLADGGLRAVLAGLVPAPAKTRFHRHGLHRRRADRSPAWPPPVEPGREHFEGMRLAGLDVDALADGSDGHGLIHDALPFSRGLAFVDLGFRSASARKAASASSQN